MAAGFGMYRTATVFTVLACNSNNYGSSEVTIGQNINPCRQCPTNMVTPTLSEATTEVKNSNATGFVHPLACVTQPGFGWDGRKSTQVNL